MSLSEDEDGVDLVLDFDDSDRLLGVEFLHPAHVPPGWSIATGAPAGREIGTSACGCGDGRVVPVQRLGSR